MKHTLLVPAILFTHLVIAQAPVIDWQTNIGGSTDDYGYFANTTSDGGYITVGSATSADGDLSSNFGDYDVLLSKLDPNGTIEWIRTLGGSLLEEASTVYQTPEGGYLITGYTRSSDNQVTTNYGGRDVWVVKTNSLGTIQWEKNYGGSNDDRAYHSAPTSDGGYILAGYTESADNDVSSNNGGADVWVLKIDSAGTVQWENNYGGSSGEYGSFISATSDGGYIVTSYSYSNDLDVSNNHGGADIWLLRISSTGTLLWQNSYGGSDEEYSTATYQTPDGGYISLNYTVSSDGDIAFSHGDFESWFMKLSAAGSIQWQESYGGALADANYGFVKTPAGKYVIAGYTYSNDGDVTGQHSGGEADYWLIQTDTSGTIEWSQCYGGTGDDQAFNVVAAADSSLTVIGLSSSSDGDVLENEGTYDCWVINLKQPVFTEITASQRLDGASPEAYPNPSSGTFRITGLANRDEIKIYSALGQEVFSSALNGPTETIDLTGFPPGVYFCRVSGIHQEHKILRLIRR